jgi:hypothetical protein
MATGSLSDGTCYENSALAADSYFSGLPPFVFSSGTSTITTYFNKVGAVWKNTQTKTSSTGVVTTNYSVNAVVPVFPTCYAPSEAFADGVNVGWALALAMAAAFGVHILTGLFKHG